MHQYLLISTCSLKREVLLRIGDYLGENIELSVYKSRICRKSLKAIEKIQNFALLQKFLRILTVFVLFKYHTFFRRYLAGTKK